MALEPRCHVEVLFDKNTEKYPPARNSGLPEFTPKIPRKYRKNTPKIPKMTVFGIFSVFLGYFLGVPKFRLGGYFFGIFCGNSGSGHLGRGSVAGGGILNSRELRDSRDFREPPDCGKQRRFRPSSRDFRVSRDSRDSSSEKTPFVMTLFSVPTYHVNQDRKSAQRVGEGFYTPPPLEGTIAMDT